MSASPSAARVTRSTAASRLRARGWLAAFEARRILPLAATTAVTLVGLVLVYGAKTADVAAVQAALAGGTVRNLAAVRIAADVEPALERILPHPGDRRFAAETIVGLLADPGAAPPANVGALARMRVPVDRIARRTDLQTFRERAAPLAGASGATGSSGASGASGTSRTLPLFTLEQFQEIKPSFIVRDASAFRRAFLLYALLYFGAVFAAHVGLHIKGRAGDRLLLPVTQLLTGLGLLALVSLRDPLRDQMLFTSFIQGIAVGGLAFVAASLPVYEKFVLRRLAYVPLLLAVALSVALVLFGTGPGESDAKVNLFGAQPVELIRLLTVLFLAGYFASRWAFLRELDEPPLGRSWLLSRLRLPRLDHALPVAGGVAIALLFFFVQKDLGPALLLVSLFLALYAVSRGHAALGVLGLVMVVAAFSACYAVGYPRTVSLRTAMWLSPWENGLARGDQLAHSLWAFAAGGVTGTGLGLGSPGVIPAAHTDLVLAAVGEELGFVGIAAALLLYAALIARGFRAARRAPDDYTTFLALGLTLSFGLQVLLILAGILGLVPLTGVVSPFTSYGRSAMVLHFAGLGMLWSITASSASARAPKAAPGHAAHRRIPGPFEVPTRWLIGIMAVMAAAVVAKVGWIQVVRADETLAAANLALQADGEYRYQLNPRLRQVAAEIPRGDILDRNGVVLATSRFGALEERRADYERLGVDIAEACSPQDERHYPFGGLTYHLLGDFETRRNWGASNTSFVERDSDAVLRGYEDHARVVTIEGPAGTEPARVVRRDLRELVPLWRHRHDPDHPAVRALLERPRDVRLTLDVRLQLRAARALREHLTAARLEKGAVVVIEPGTGDVLASVSRPWPAGPLRGPARPRGDAGDADRGGRSEQALLDRARYGVYPPGSTFKLVTAAAALERDPALERAIFNCRSLPDGRAGAVVGGRPVRDDQGHEPHGDVSMERATIVSCNAYFAQLGSRIGWPALAAKASQFEIPVGEPRTGSERRANLIEASYGQAQVLASPFKMARVAATIAQDGKLAAGRWVLEPPDERSGPPRAIMEATAAGTLGRYMRGVVEHGTGRRLASQSPPIAGKTGTAQVRSGPPHAWFIGYAPYGRASRRVAFAVLLENGGYGGEVPAEVAGEVVQAASELGLIQ